jgi:predicted AAA+ superfamily ATPase
MRGKALLEDASALGLAVETAFFKHVYTRYYAQSVGFSYWRGGPREQEVDIIADVNGRLVPFEVKHRPDVTARMLSGLTAFCTERKVTEAYVITRDSEDFGTLKLPTTGVEATAVKIPAHLACYWLGRSEILATSAESG